MTLVIGAIKVINGVSLAHHISLKSMVNYLLIYCRYQRYFLETDTGRELLRTFFFWGITLRKISIYSEESTHIIKEKYEP